MTDRHVRRLLVALRERGDGAVVHGLRGRPSFEQKILACIRQRYADFGPTLVAEHLAEEGCKVSRETLRKWMSGAKLWHPRAQRVKTMHVWRERRAQVQELVGQAGLQILRAILEDEVTRRVGPPHRPNPSAGCVRWGKQPG